MTTGFSRLARVTLLLVSMLSFGAAEARSEVFSLPPDGDSVVGEIRYTRVSRGETLVDIARSFDLGYTQIVRANAGLKRWGPPEGARVVLPSMYVLPKAKREGIVINLAEYRMYYYPPRSGTVETHPVSVGRMDWGTPKGVLRVVQKLVNPQWNPPKSIRDEAIEDGEPLPAFIPGGAPDNPLGSRALKLSNPMYLIHGVDERKAFGIGMQVTHGCIRMYPEDMEHVFEQVPLNTPVRIVDEPVKIGRRDGVLYLEVHRPIEAEDRDPLERYVAADVFEMVAKTPDAQDYVDTQFIRTIFDEGSGVPTPLHGTPVLPGDLGINRDMQAFDRRSPALPELPNSATAARRPRFQWDASEEPSEPANIARMTAEQRAFARQTRSGYAR